jgi:hypothetical protein
VYGDISQTDFNLFSAPLARIRPSFSADIGRGIPGLGSPVDSVSIGDSFPLSSSAGRMLTRQVASRFNTIDRLAQSLTPEVPPQTTRRNDQGTGTQENVPKYLSMMDGLRSDLTNALPYNGEGSFLGTSISNWGTSRDGAVREMENAEKERNFALETMKQRLDEIEKRKANLQQQLADKQAQEEIKRREMERIQSEKDSLQNTDTDNIDGKIAEAGSKVEEKQSSVSSKEQELSQLKIQLYEEPEKSSEIQGKINNLEREIASEKLEMYRSMDDKRRLETEKAEKERKKQEDELKKHELEARVNQINSEINSLQQEEVEYRTSMAAQDTGHSQLRDDVQRRQAEMAQLRWIISNFEYKTRGLGL